MLKKLFLSTLISINLFSAAFDFSEIKSDREKGLINFKQTKDISQIKNEAKEKILELWNNYANDTDGHTSIEFLIDPSFGKIDGFFVLSRTSNPIFQKRLKSFLKKVKKIDLHNKSLDGKEFSLVLNLSSSNKISKITPSTVSLVNTEEDIYNNAIKSLLTKGYSKRKIKEQLHSKADSFVKNLLYGIYYGYKKHNFKLANQYLTKAYLNRDNTEYGLYDIYAADFFLRYENFEKIADVLPRFSCANIDSELKESCYYYQSIGFYTSGIPYRNSLMWAQTNEKFEILKDFLKNIEKR